MTDDPLAQERRHPLTVLPSSGKIEQLRREAEATPRPVPTADAPLPAGGAAPAATGGADVERKLLEAKIIEAIRQVYDPEIPVNIHDLGLIYDIDIRDDASVVVQMTLTTPGCPVAGSLPAEVERRVEAVAGVKSAEIVLVWDPPWSKDRMSESALLEMGF